MCRRCQRGSMVAVAYLFTMLVAVFACGIADLSVAGIQAERATSAADSAAHAALAVLNAQPDREALSIETQAARVSCTFDAAQSTGDPADARCLPGLQAARRMAERNGAILQAYTIGPERHQVTASSGAVGFEVLVRVAVPRNLPLWPVSCTGPPPADAVNACWAVTLSAAQEAA